MIRLADPDDPTEKCHFHNQLELLQAQVDYRFTEVIGQERFIDKLNGAKDNCKGHCGVV